MEECMIEMPSRFPFRASLWVRNSRAVWTVDFVIFYFLAFDSASGSEKDKQ
jgi:hypothetical protein